MNQTFRDQLKAIVKEVLIEELEKPNPNQQEDTQQGVENRGKVRDPQRDRRLKGNREQAA